VWKVDVILRQTTSLLKLFIQDVNRMVLKTVFELKKVNLIFATVFVGQNERASAHLCGPFFFLFFDEI